MTSKQKQASDKGTVGSHPMPIHEFNEKLNKESPALLKKLQGREETKFASEEQFYNELKSHAPKLYEEVKKCDFQFQLDKATKNEWLAILKNNEKITHALEKLEEGVEELEEIKHPNKAKK